MDIIGEIIEELKHAKSRDDVRRIKKEVCKRHRVSRIPGNTEILGHVDDALKERLSPLLRRKPIRTISGIAVVAVMARPWRCPHGTCLYCPKGEDTPQSYTGREPAAMRAMRYKYDPYAQVKGRLRQLQLVGHPTDKVELIIMGGTFLAQPAKYKEWFVKRCLEAMNGVDGEGTLEDVQKANEQAGVRNVGITFESRPDYAMEQNVDEMLKFGGTRVELGVQTLSNEVYGRVGRGHSIEDVIKATRILKDAGLKVGYHMMPFLFSDMKKDLRMFKKLFGDERFRPDALKIYPTLVIKGTGIYELWKKGSYAPCTDEEAVELITKVKKLMPKWVRTMRIQRDIPRHLIEAGVKKGNLGELVGRRLNDEKARCRCIKCRDIGHLSYKEGIEVDGDSVDILVEKYRASSGLEYFISVEDRKNDALIAYLRLRFPSEIAHRHEINPNTALVRELRVLGSMVPLGRRISKYEQHKGWGGLLLKRAEDLSEDAGMEEILVTSAIGTREYYRRFGYRKVRPYMSKILS